MISRNSGHLHAVKFDMPTFESCQGVACPNSPQYWLNCLHKDACKMRLHACIIYVPGHLPTSYLVLNPEPNMVSRAIPGVNNDTTL